MSTEFGNLLKNIKNSTMQNVMRNNSTVSTDINLNFKIAYYIYNYLVGKDNKLPSYNYLSRVIDEVWLSQDVISSGCGITVFCKNKKDLYIEIETPITPKTRRVDLITADVYEAYKCIDSENDRVENLTMINPEINPIFNPQRVKILQNYFKKYTLNMDNDYLTKQDSSNENNLSPKIK